MRLHRLCLPVLVAGSFVLLAGSPARAADVAPHLVGVVVDTAGTQLPNAHVVIPEVGRTTTTGVAGEFEFRGLAPGEYHLNVTLIGFAPGHVVAVIPTTGETVRLRIVLAPTPLRLTSVVVSASPTGTESERLTQTAVELSGRTLARTIGSSVAATLATEAGMSQRYGGPAATMPVIRGLTGDRVLVLQDGERAGDLASASGDHGVSVDPLAAQRIEVVRGPASLLYGNNALGGVVNVVSNDIPTAVPSHLEGTVSTQGESVTPGGAAQLALTGGLGATGALSVRAGWRDIGALRTGGGGRLAGTDARTSNATLGFGHIGERATIGVAVRRYEFDYGVPSAPDEGEAGIRLAGRRTGLSTRGTLPTGRDRLPIVKFDASSQDYAHDELEPDGAVGTHFALRTQTAQAQVTTAFGEFEGAVGVQGLFKQYAASGEEAMTPAADSRGLGAFLYQQVDLRRGAGHEAGHVGGVQLQVGARWDAYDIRSKTGDPKFGAGQTVSFGQASGSLGLSYAVTEAVTLSGSLARAFRAPTVEELFSNGVHAAAGSYDVGTPDLRAETSTGGEVILRVKAARASGQVSTYRNRVADYVFPAVMVQPAVVGVDTLPLVRYLQADAQLRGVEGQVDLRLGRYLVASAMGDVVRGAFVGGGPLPFMPPARLGGGLRWEGARVTVAGDLRHAFAQDRVTGDDVDVATAAYTLANLSASSQWMVGNVLHVLTVRADNLTDARYFDAASRIKRFAPNPGRNVSLVYQVTF